MEKKLILKRGYSIFLKIVIVLIIVGAIVNVGYRKYEENVLKKELEVLDSKDVRGDSFQTSIKTIGTYSRVETKIKEYLNDYSESLKKIREPLDDNQLKGMLSSTNYSADGPAFTNTITYLNTLEENILKNSEYFYKIASSDTIISYIEGQNFSSYYQKLYEDYLIKHYYTRFIEEEVLQIKKMQDNVIQLIQKEKQVIQFLIQSKSWTIKDNHIIFSKEEDLGVYNQLIQEIM